MDCGARQPLTYAGFWRRLLAYLVDGLLLVPLAFPFTCLSSSSRGVAVAWNLSTTLMCIGYAVYFHRRWGQTLGKMAAGIRVVTTDGLPISWGESLLRSSVAIGLSLMYSFGFAVALARIPAAKYAALDWGQRIERLLEPDPVLDWLMVYVQMFWLVSELVVLLLNEKRRALHDFIAGTVVVLARPGGSHSRPF